MTNVYLAQNVDVYQDSPGAIVTDHTKTVEEAATSTVRGGDYF